MRACCRLGRRNAALEQYQRCRETVLTELGAEPMIETTELWQAVLEGRFEVARAPEAVPVEMPAHGTDRMAEPPPVSPASTFVVRFWHEWSVDGSRWRGRIEHVQSGESTPFLDFDHMLNFIRRFAAVQRDESQPASEDG
jgi:hypothetical protein